MSKYNSGDFVKIEIRGEHGGPSEWLWLLVDHSDDEQRVVFGTLDNDPIVNTDMRLGQELAVSYDNIREHMMAKSFNQ